MVEENSKHRQKYSKKMMDKVDQFEGKVYDSSYIMWVPLIQQKVKPLLMKIINNKRE